MNKYSILFVTGTRAEFGIMQPLLKRLNSSELVDLDLVVTGTHLETEYGNTVNQIKKDKFNIIKTIPLNLIDTSNLTIGNSLGILTTELNKVFNNQQYDLVLILGDRYEMLPVANLSVLYRVPICHLHGGELTFGNYDEHIRHSLTKMSSLHLTSTEEYKNRVISLGENPSKVFNIGAMGVENALSNLYNKQELSSLLGINLDETYLVVLYHPVTLYSKEEAERELDALIRFISDSTYKVFVIGNNADTGANIFRERIKQVVDNKRVHEFKSLEVREFHSLIKYSKCLVGNSSSGIIEVPSLNVPTVNIGKRQLGRISGPSVININGELSEIENALKISENMREFFNPYYKENSVESAFSIIMNELSAGLTSAKIFHDTEQ